MKDKVKSVIKNGVKYVKNEDYHKWVKYKKDININLVKLAFIIFVIIINIVLINAFDLSFNNKERFAQYSFIFITSIISIGINFNIISISQTQEDITDEKEKKELDLLLKLKEKYDIKETISYKKIEIDDYKGSLEKNKEYYKNKFKME